MLPFVGVRADLASTRATAPAPPADAPAHAASILDRLTPEMNAPDWLAAYAEQLGIAVPTPDDVEAVLDLAGEAAHSSERIAAPVACWMAARAGVELADAMRLAQAVSAGG